MPVVKTSKSKTPERHQFPEVTALYTDGACSGNPGPGGWGAIAYLSNGNIHEMGGAARETTNNRMEIQAAIEILQWFSTSPQTTPPSLHTDSKYVQDGITKWIKGWKKKNWKTTAGKAVLNQDLWKQLDAITQLVNAKLSSPVQWRYVKGHAGNEGNERCDAIARGFSKGQYPALITTTPWDDEHRPLASAAVAMEEKADRGPMTSVYDHSTQSDAPKQLTVSSISPLKQTENQSPPDPIHGALNEDEVADRNRSISRSNTMMNHMIERLRMVDEIASNGYWIDTPELALLLDIPHSIIESKGERWLWRNWSVLTVRREDAPVLWQLERVD